jgi:hypothetical protein
VQLMTSSPEHTSRAKAKAFSIHDQFASLALARAPGLACLCMHACAADRAQITLET